MAVVAVGDFEPERVEEKIREHFNRLQPVEDPRPRKEWPVPDHAETLWVSTTDPELTQTSVSVYTKLPRESSGTYGDFRRSLVKSLTSRMLSVRFDERTREADPPFLYGYASESGMVRSRAVFAMGAGVREGGVERGLEAVLREVARVEQHGFTATELERAKISVLRFYEQAYRERDKTRSKTLAAELRRHFLEDESVPGITAELELVQRFLPTVSLDEINQTAQAKITEENRVILVSGPEKEGVELPSKEALLTLLEKTARQDVEAYVDKVLEAPLVAEMPAPGKVVEEKTIAEVGITEWRLSNGVRVILKPTDFKNDEILLSGWSPGGTSLVDDTDFISATFATMLLGQSGLGEFGAVELAKALTGKVASASPSLGELEEGMRGSASPEDVETMFQLLYLHFTAPRLEEIAVQSVMSRLAVMIQNRLSAPATVFRDRITEVLSQDHPRRQPVSLEMLDAVDPQQALAVYRERFADASDFSFVVVGNFTPDGIRPLVETWLGGLPSTGREEIWRDIGVHGPDSKEEIELRMGLEPKSQVRLFWEGPAEWTRQESHLISSLASVLNIRLREVLREDMGATYGVGVGGSISLRPRQEFSLSVGFGCAPEDVPATLDALFAELRSIQENGIDESYVEKVRESQRRKREVNVRENSFWLGVLQAYYNRGEDPRLVLEYEPLVESVTAERVQQAARRYIDLERYVQAVLYPEASGGN
jgi:zinc protease